MSEELNQKVEALAKKLFKDGKNPIEAFGLNWEALTSLEADAPEIVTNHCEPQRKSA